MNFHCFLSTGLLRNRNKALSKRHRILNGESSLHGWHRHLPSYEHSRGKMPSFSAVAGSGRQIVSKVKSVTLQMPVPVIQELFGVARGSLEPEGRAKWLRRQAIFVLRPERIEPWSLHSRKRHPPPKGMGAFFGTMAPGGLKRAMETFSAINRGGQKGYGKKRVMPLTDVESMVGVRRMQFLCNLIAKARKPYCQINGMLQAIPFSWTSEIDYARKLAPAIKDDLVAVHETFQLQFPVVAVVTEMDSVTGMRDFLLRAERMQPGLRLSRSGSSFAAGADVNDKNAEWIVDRGMQWFRGWVYTAFSSDIDNRDNQKLFQMLCEISQRRQGLITLLRDSLYRIVQPGPRLHGVYFSATGRASTEQGFIRGVLDKLPESQGMVAWAPQLVRAQQRSKTLTVCFFIGAAVLAAAAIAVYVYKIAGAT